MEYGHYMRLALDEAEKAFIAAETPIGCVIVNEIGQITGRGRNMCNEKKNALYHAEIIAVNEACAAAGDWRLPGHTLFVTIEPCPMCAGAIIMSRITTVVFGANNPKAGCAGSVFNLLQEKRFNHRVNVFSGVLGDECGRLMTRFFREYISINRKN